MATADEIDALAERCIKAYEAIVEHGTPEMQATMRILLFQIGQELARREIERNERYESE